VKLCAFTKVVHKEFQGAGCARVQVFELVDRINFNSGCAELRQKHSLERKTFRV
jgi:hypothetical protein